MVEMSIGTQKTPEVHRKLEGGKGGGEGKIRIWRSAKRRIERKFGHLLNKVKKDLS